jgi:hypothetical protein
MVSFRNESTPEMRQRFCGVMETTWTRTDGFLRGFYQALQKPNKEENSSWNCFIELFSAIDKL